MVEFTYGGTHAEPTQTRIIPASALQHEGKWTRFPRSDVRTATAGFKLSDFFKVQRGLATGDNRFFIMTRAQIAERGLPPEFFKPILPGPRHIPGDEIEAEPDGTPKIERQLFRVRTAAWSRAPFKIKMRVAFLWISWSFYRYLRRLARVTLPGSARQWLRSRVCTTFVP